MAVIINDFEVMPAPGSESGVPATGTTNARPAAEAPDLDRLDHELRRRRERRARLWAD